MSRDAGSGIRPVMAVVPQEADAGAVDGVAIDRQGFLSCVVFHGCGEASGLPEAQKVSIKVQHADTADGTYADYATLSDLDLEADKASGRATVDLTMAKRYIRVVQTVAFTSGSTPKIPVFATVILGAPDYRPA